MTIPPGFFNEEVSQFGLESIEQTTVRAFSRKILDDAFENIESLNILQSNSNTLNDDFSFQSKSY